MDIYVFVNKLERHPVKNVDIAFLTVYYHELTHLTIYNTALHLTLRSNDIQNFEEPFCDVLFVLKMMYYPTGRSILLELG